MMRTPRLVTPALGHFIAFFLPHPTDARNEASSRGSADQLGLVNLLTSCSGEVQPAIEEGVALLHSFRYRVSEQTFAEAATRDAKCAMARWGKAMARYHQLWDFPDDKILREGHLR